MDVKEAGASLDSLVSQFNSRIAELQQFVIARNMYPASSISDLSGIDAALKGMELQVQNIKDRLRDEAQAIPKAKKLIEAALRQQKKLETVSACIPSYIPERITGINPDTSKCMQPEISQLDHGIESLKLEEPAQKEKKGRAPPPMWYITGGELNSLPSYMKQRLTLDKVNAAIGDMVTYAGANAQLITAPRKKLIENNLDRALELRDIAMMDAVKGKHFFLESDVKGQSNIDGSSPPRSDKRDLSWTSSCDHPTETTMTHFSVIALCSKISIRRTFMEFLTCVILVLSTIFYEISRF